jgi:hypothetical protein
VRPLQPALNHCVVLLPNLRTNKQQASAGLLRYCCGSLLFVGSVMALPGNSTDTTALALLQEGWGCVARTWQHQTTW